MKRERLLHSEGDILRRFVALVVPIVGLLLVTQNALAAAPTITKFPIEPFDGVDSTCGFDVAFQGTAGGVDISWTSADGQVREITAFNDANIVLTNLATGRTIHQNYAGPSFLTLNPDGSGTLVGTGTGLWGSNPATGEPGFFATEGRFVFSLDSQGNLTFSIVGHIEDLCAELAA